MAPPPPPIRDEHRPFPTALSSVPLAPRRKLRDGQDSARSGRSMSRLREGSAGGGTGTGTSSRASSSGSATHARHAQLGEGSSTNSSRSIPSINDSTSSTFAQEHLTEAPALSSPSELRTGPPSATVHHATNAPRPFTGNMEFMRGLGWEVRDIEPPNYANPALARAGDEHGEYGEYGRDGIIAAVDGTGTTHLQSGTTPPVLGLADIINIDASDPAEVDSLFDNDAHIDVDAEAADAASPDPWDPSHPSLHPPRHSTHPTDHLAHAARAPRVGRGRSPSPAGSAGGRAGSRSPSPMLPLPMHISARAALGGLGRLEVEERAREVVGEEGGEGEGGGDEPGAEGGGEAGQGVEADGAIQVDGTGGIGRAGRSTTPRREHDLLPRADSATVELPEWPAHDEYDQDNHREHNLPGVARQGDPATDALERASGLLGRLDTWNHPNSQDIIHTANPAIPTRDPPSIHNSTLTASQEVLAPTTTLASRNSSSDSVIMLDAPPTSTQLSDLPSACPARRAGVDGVARGSSSSSSSSSQSGASDAGSGNGPESGESGERRYTRAEKGKGRAEPLANATAPRAPPTRQGVDSAGREADEDQDMEGEEEGDGDIVFTGVGTRTADAGTRVMSSGTGNKRSRQQVDTESPDSDTLTDIDSDTPLADRADRARGGGRDTANDSVQWFEPPAKRARYVHEGEGEAEGASGRGGGDEIVVNDEQDEEGDNGDLRKIVMDKRVDEERRRTEDPLMGVNTHTCPICMDELSQPVMTPCGHVYCYPCFIQGLMNAIANNPNPYPGQPLPATQTGRGRNGQAITAHRTAVQRGSGATVRGLGPGAAAGGAAGAAARGRGNNGRGNKRAAAASVRLLDPTVPPPDAFELQPARWTAPALARAIREHQRQKELKGYKDGGMDAKDAQAVVDALHADDAPVPEETAHNRAEVEGVKEVLRGLWEVKIPRPAGAGGAAAGGAGAEGSTRAGAGAAGGGGGEKEWVIEGECHICRTALPGGMGPWDSGIGGVVPLSARLIDRNDKSRARRRVKKEH